jgi:hypothetical protein
LAAAMPGALPAIVADEAAPYVFTNRAARPWMNFTAVAIVTRKYRNKNKRLSRTAANAGRNPSAAGFQD